MNEKLSFLFVFLVEIIKVTTYDVIIYSVLISNEFDSPKLNLPFQGTFSQLRGDYLKEYAATSEGNFQKR